MFPEHQNPHPSSSNFPVFKNKKLGQARKFGKNCHMLFSQEPNIPKDVFDVYFKS